jgi:hypothetical protein
VFFLRGRFGTHHAASLATRRDLRRTSLGEATMTKFADLTRTVAAAALTVVFSGTCLLATLAPVDTGRGAPSTVRVA